MEIETQLNATQAIHFSCEIAFPQHARKVFKLIWPEHLVLISIFRNLFCITNVPACLYAKYPAESS